MEGFLGQHKTPLKYVYQLEVAEKLDYNSPNHHFFFLLFHTDSKSIRDNLKLNRPDAGWYQIRQAIKSRNSSSDFPPVSFDSFDSAYTELTDKILPDIYKLGFLRP